MKDNYEPAKHYITVEKKHKGKCGVTITVGGIDPNYYEGCWHGSSLCSAGVFWGEVGVAECDGVNLPLPKHGWEVEMELDVENSAVVWKKVRELGEE